MSDNLKELGAQFKSKQATKTTTPPTPTPSTIPTVDLDALLEQRLNPTQSPSSRPKASPAKQTPAPTPTNTTKRATAKTSTSTGSINVEMPPDLDAAIRSAADQNDVWLIEYIRSAIANYGGKIAINPKETRRRRSRTPNNYPARTYKLGSVAKQQLEQAAKRTNRSQTGAFKQILRSATADNFAPTIAE